MANSISSFFQTLVAAGSEASQVLAPSWKALGSVYMDYKPVAADIGQTLNIAIPQDPTNAVADQGASDPVLTDIGFSTTPIVFDQHPSLNFVIRDFEQFNSASDIRNLFLDGALKAVKSYINGRITRLFTSANFAVNTPISATAHVITTDQFLSGYSNLSDQKVPVQDDPANMSLLLPSLPYTGILGNANWTQAQVAGMKTAEAVHDTGVMPIAYGATLKLDQQMPTTGTAGSRTFTAAYLHKFAVAVVTRPLPQPDTNVVEVTYLDFGGIPVRVQIGYNQWPKQGFIVTIDAGFGVKVVRPEMCQLFSIAE